MELSPRIYNWLVRPGWYNKKFTKKVLKNKYIFDDKMILDFGCGIGSNCFLFKPGNYLGVDINKRRIEYAKYINPRYNFELLDNKIKSSKNSIDIILLIAVLHHIPDSNIAAIIKEFKRILKYPSGIILVMEPCFFEEKLLNNYYMKLFDRGKYIRNREGYFKIFKNNNFLIRNEEIISKIAYKELFFSASQI